MSRFRQPLRRLLTTRFGRSLSLHICGLIKDSASARYDPDRIVTALVAAGYQARIELERVVLRHPNKIPIVVPLRFPLWEVQARAYLANAGYSSRQIGLLLAEWWLLDDPLSFIEPPGPP